MRLLSIFLYGLFFGSALYAASLRFQHPTMTDAQITIAYWPLILTPMVLGVLAVAAGNRDYKAGRR